MQQNDEVTDNFYMMYHMPYFDISKWAPDPQKHVTTYKVENKVPDSFEVANGGFSWNGLPILFRAPGKLCIDFPHPI